MFQQRDCDDSMGRTVRSSWEVLAGRRESIINLDNGEEAVSAHEVKRALKQNPEMNSKWSLI